MALSTALMTRLQRVENDEPLSKRLKLAENVIYSTDISILHKEDCVFRWLCSELKNQNNCTIWIALHRCLSVDPKNFSRLLADSKTLLIEKIIQSLNDFPGKKVSEETVKCCASIFSIANSQSYLKKNSLLLLIDALIKFTLKVLTLNEIDQNKQFVNTALAIECVEFAINRIVQITKLNISDKNNLILIFIEELLFSLALFVQIIKEKKIPSKIVIESKKCLKILILNSLKNIAQSSESLNDKIETDVDIFFNTLKTKVNVTKIENLKIIFSFIFDCAVTTFGQNSTTIDYILRRLWNCVEGKKQSKQILAALLENSVDVSYNFDHEIDGLSLKLFLKTQIEEILSKKKCYECSDYDLLSAISKINPLIIEDVTQSLLDRIIFEKKSFEKEINAYENLLVELWKSAVLLRRQHKFVSKFLLVFKCNKEQLIDDEYLDKFKLPGKFVIEFNQVLKSRTTSSQILAILNTLLYHFKTDCINKLETSDSIPHTCLLIKVVANFLVIFLEHANFLDSSLTQEWQMKFYQTFTDLHNSLIMFSEILSTSLTQHETIIFVSFSNIVKIWCEVYDLLRYYIPNICSKKLDFPINQFQLKNLKQVIKESKNQECKESLSQLILFKSITYNKNSKHIPEKIVLRLWSVIIENHFEIVESFNESQLLQLASYLINEASCTDDNLFKWTLVLKRNTFQITKIFATAIALHIVLNIIEDTKCSSIKSIIQNIDFKEVLKSVDNENNCNNEFKCTIEEIAKQNFKSSNIINPDKMKRNLIFMSNLPLSIIDVKIRKFLFLVLYAFDEETKRTNHLKEYVKNLYIDLISQIDLDILNIVSKPLVLIEHFKDDQTILLKIFKSSINNLSALKFLEEFVDKEECNRKICSLFLICIENSKSKVFMSNNKNKLQTVCLKLSDKIIKELNEEINSSYEIAGLRVLLKILLSNTDKLEYSLKSHIIKTLKNFTEDTETFSNDKLINEILQLSLVVLENREQFDITENIIKDLCIVFINNPNEKIFFHFLEVLRDNEFQFFVKSFNKKTKESLLNCNIQDLERLIKIWRNLSKAETKGTRTKIVSSSVNNLLNELLASGIKNFSIVFIFKICRTFVTSKRMIRLTHILVDSIFVISMECLNDLSKEVKLLACQEALGLCLDFMRSKLDFVLDRLPMLTNLFRKIAKVIFEEVKNTEDSDNQVLKILAIDIEKFCKFFAKLKKDVVRISPFLIADLILMSYAMVLPSFLKVSIDFSISHLLSNCDRHAINFLSRTLPTSAQQVFKTAHYNYLKYTKFTGNI